VRLTVDGSLQHNAWDALQGETGAIVILDLQSGDILALVSSPSFDANQLDADWQTLIDREDAPLLNRATQGLYQPGMIFAPFTLAWSEASGLVHVEDRVLEAAHPFSVEGVLLNCRLTLSDGEEVDYSHVLRARCPRPIAELGTELGAAGLEEMVQAFAFNRPPAIRLETAPAMATVMGSIARDWQTAAIGQGDLTVTPLQVARAFGVIIRDGYLPSLRIVSAVKDMNGRWQEVDSLGQREQAIDAGVSEKIRAALASESGSLFSYSARAIVGSEDESLSWYVCSNLNGLETVRLVLVVLEDASEVRAKAIGLSLIDW
jgi:penicillin-binding protein A